MVEPPLALGVVEPPLAWVGVPLLPCLFLAVVVVLFALRAGRGAAAAAAPARRHRRGAPVRRKTPDRRPGQQPPVAGRHAPKRSPGASRPHRTAPAEGFYYPDDAFFAKHGTAIITNQEDQDTIIELAYPSGAVIASYGHPGNPEAAPGYLAQPDDAYLLAKRRVTVADAMNCRLVFLNADFTYQGEIGTDHRCVHNPPTDLGYPNGDTPLANGDFLVSEITGSFVDELRPDGSVVWSVHLPIAYPSDPQQLGADLYLIADYSKPGGV